MKKILFITLLSLGFVSNVHAFAIDDITAGVDKHRVDGFGEGDAFQADANAAATTVALTDVGTLVTANNILNTDGLTIGGVRDDGFIHDYLFGTVETDFFSISSVSETSGGSAGTFIDPLVMEIWEIVAGASNDILLDSDTMTQIGANSREAAVFVMLEAGKNYVVRMTNEGGTVGSTADYSLEIVSAIPVPAAVWLFGSALLGLMGFRRKSGAAATAA